MTYVHSLVVSTPADQLTGDKGRAARGRTSEQIERMEL
jgi:hypothetical protein